MRTAKRAAQVLDLQLQLDLFAGLEEATARAEVLSFPKTRTAEAVQAVLHRRNARNFVIGRELDCIGDPERKFADNVAAIQTLRRIELEDRAAAEEEKRILVRYTGWGGLPQAFDMTSTCAKPDWRSALTELLSQEEWEAARASVNNAHYTDPVVVRFIWGALARMGFSGGRIIEPAAGIGHFIGCMPQEIAAVSQIHAVEIEAVSASILEALYPDAVVYAKGFEKVTFPSGSFDLAISNVPFGRYRLADPKYDRLKLSIHDYFFAKSLDLVRPGGIVAFVTSHFTLDKHSQGFREYLAARAELLAAVRLPSGAFAKIAGTEVMADILFLRKRERMVPSETVAACDWIETQPICRALWSGYGNPSWANGYWNSHNDHVIGNFHEASGHHMKELVCKFDGDLQARFVELAAAMPLGAYVPKPAKPDSEFANPECHMIPAPGAIKPGGYGVIDGVLMRNESGLMQSVEASLPTKTVERIKGMLAIRDCVRELLRGDLAGAHTAPERATLNRLYDEFVSKQGPLWSRANRAAMKGDPDQPVILSLEYWDEEREAALKAEIFQVCTVSRSHLADSAENLTEAIALSLNRYGRLHLEEIGRWLSKPIAAVETELADADLAFPDPGTDTWVMRDEYLSGNVREKLALAETALASDPSMARNVEAIRAVVPRDLLPAEIDVRLGAPWVPNEDVAQFAQETLDESIEIAFSEAIAGWQVSCSEWKVSHSVPCTQTWGTPRMFATEILSYALNQRIPTVYDRVERDGRDAYVVNHVETVAARDKWHSLREAFKQWIWKDPERSARLARLYNDLYNGCVDRIYDGAHLALPGINPAISLRPAQKNAIWRSLVSGRNTLLAHAVGAGKTMIFVAAAMEAKRLGLCRKPLFTVPNHMLDQVAAEFLRLYPQANILAAGKDDLTGDKRRNLLARIATGEWDGIIVTHSSFEKLPLSDERIRDFIVEETVELEDAIRKLEAAEDGRNTRLVKRIEQAKKQVVAKIESILGRHRKDGGLSFEELGIDWLSVDEAHLHKNLFYTTKMDRVAGLPQTSSMRAFDLFLKTQAIRDARGDRKGVVFATATPIANAVAELYTMQRYLQLNRLKELGLHHFDNWAASFGETVTSVELAPDGSGYRLHTRFARYVNLPELMSIFREVADIQTKEMLKLPEPALQGGKHEVVKVPASQAVKDFVQTLVARAEAIRGDNGSRPDPREDNMLMVTTDGRKAALDMRLVDPCAADDAESKVNEAVRQIHAIWLETATRRLTQLAFCDQSTPSSKAFSVYHDIRGKLVAMGVPSEEIAFIHDFDSDTAKAKLFRKVREGSIRILMGSTSKMGLGTNVQDRLYAEHHLDAPWRPADVEQRDGRILRQGNSNPSVRILRYVTEQSFDAYVWQTLETKMRFIAQVMTGDGGIRTVEEVELAALSYAEVKAIASGNPLVLEKAGVDAEIARLSLVEKAWHKRLTEMRWRIHEIDHRVENLTRLAQRTEEDLRAVGELAGPIVFQAIDGTHAGNRDEAGRAIVLGIERAKRLPIRSGLDIGRFGPFAVRASRFLGDMVVVELVGAGEYGCNEVKTVAGALTILENTVKGLPAFAANQRQAAENLKAERMNLEQELVRPFEHEERLNQLILRQRELDADLGLSEDQGADLEAEAA